MLRQVDAERLKSGGFAFLVQCPEMVNRLKIMNDDMCDPPRPHQLLSLSPILEASKLTFIAVFGSVI